jgi:hypothetical protein
MKSPKIGETLTPILMNLSTADAHLMDFVVVTGHDSAGVKLLSLAGALGLAPERPSHPLYWAVAVPPRLLVDGVGLVLCRSW